MPCSKTVIAVAIIAVLVIDITVTTTIAVTSVHTAECIRLAIIIAVITMIITVFAVPLDKMIEKCLDEVKIFVDTLKVRTGGDIYSTEDLENQELGDELKDVQTIQNTFVFMGKMM